MTVEALAIDEPPTLTAAMGCVDCGLIFRHGAVCPGCKSQSLLNVAAVLGPGSVHDWTHPAESCDEPDCEHVTRRTCEGAERLIKWLMTTLRRRTELLCKADPAWARQAEENLLRAIFEIEDEDRQDAGPSDPAETGVT